MIIASPRDYRRWAKKKLPRFLFDYIDGGSYQECTLANNLKDIQAISLKQRVLKNVGHINLETSLFGVRRQSPIALSPVGLTGMYARRGEVQMARAAANQGIPYTLSSVSICPIQEVAKHSSQAIWFQLYVLKDKGFMRHVLTRALEAGVNTLVFTVDLPMPGARYRETHSGMSGPFKKQRRLGQALLKPRWAWDVGFKGRPHQLGNISDYFGHKVGMEDYTRWIDTNFDPSIAWSDVQWIREFWPGTLLIKGILDPDDAKEAIAFGADGIIVSNHGGRQLDGALSTAKALPPILDVIGDEVPTLVDSGARSGLDVLRFIALGAKAVMLGRAPIYALAARGQAGVEHALELILQELRIAMTLCGVSSIGEIDSNLLVHSPLGFN